MSDEFDKEAEREKLRKKFSEDEQKREHTQRLSELLLQGATMTNRHCETCGDPIFRHEGREFCPTCHATEDGYEVPIETPAAADDGNDADEAASTAVDADTTAGATTDADATADTTAGADTESVASGAVSAPPTDRSTADERATDSSSVAAAESAAPSPDASVESPATDAATRRSNTDTGDVAAARDAVVQTLTRFARAAADTEDPRRARERLAAAKEAAETLAALDR